MPPIWAGPSAGSGGGSYGGSFGDATKPRPSSGASPAPTSSYPSRSFSATSLRTRSAAASHESRSLTCVCPFVPMRPNRTVTWDPLWPISQNLFDVPPTYSNRRIAGFRVRFDDHHRYGRRDHGQHGRQRHGYEQASKGNHGPNGRTDYRQGEDTDEIDGRDLEGEPAVGP